MVSLRSCHAGPYPFLIAHCRTTEHSCVSPLEKIDNMFEPYA